MPAKCIRQAAGLPGRSETPSNSTTLIVPTLQRGNAILTLQRHQDSYQLLPAAR